MAWKAETPTSYDGAQKRHAGRQRHRTTGYIAMFYILLYILPYRNPSRINIIPSPPAERLGERGVVLREVLVAVGVEDGLAGVARREALRGGLAVDVVVGATVGSEVGGLWDARQGLGTERVCERSVPRG